MSGPISGRRHDAATRFRWQFWRSPADQPGWARPALLGIAVLAGLAYGWGIAQASVESFYGAAARSMSQSWHDFIFGAFDPAGTVSVDKLPGALWVQALSLRLFGFHIWALVLPQVVEGVLTVLVLYHAVRRLAGAPAGLAAAAVLAVTPVTVLLNRGNVSDSLLVLLLVLAADATSAALSTGRLRTLCLAGLWVGLAFQTKMIQAWLVLPALAAAYLLAGPAERLRTRIGHVAVAGLVTVVVSLSWMTAVSLVPAHDRPYVDGSRDDSVYSQVFYYNGIARVEGGDAVFSAPGPPEPFLSVLIQDQDLANSSTLSIGPGWNRLLTGSLGRDAGWLLPAVLAGAIAALVSRRGRGRADPLGAAVVLWGGWWVLLVVFFSAGSYLNSYYIAALTPAMAALCGTGVAALADARPKVRAAAVLATAAACVGYGLYLLHGAAVVPWWLWPAAVSVLIVAAALTLITRAVAAVAAVAALLIIPATASVTVVVRGLGPFDTPFESHQISDTTKPPPGYGALISEDMQRLKQMQPHRRYVLAVDTSILAAPFILYSGDEVLPIGGYFGGVAAPTLSALQSDIDNGYVQLFRVPLVPRSPDPRVRWVQQHCAMTGHSTQPNSLEFATYSCARQASASGNPGNLP
jgi:4-amino-4-deoxy-L-arabinose transferase-like glycosyltransferase